MVQELLHKQLSGFGHHVSMYVYIQASILATQTKACNPSHYLLNILHTKLTWNKRKFHNLGVTIRWIPSHLEIKGNKEADRQAKCAIKGNADTPINRLSRELCDRLLDSWSAIQQYVNKNTQKDAAHHLHKSPQWRKLRHIDPTMPSKRYRMMADSLLHKQASLLIQLRTGHAPLNKHLFNIKSADSPICPACKDTHKTVHHFLLLCPAYEQPPTSLILHPQSRITVPCNPPCTPKSNKTPVQIYQ